MRRKTSPAHDWAFSPHQRMSIAAIVALVLAAAPQVAPAQTFDSGSKNGDGVLSFTEPGTVVFDQLDDNGDGVYEFETITIGPGVTVRLSARQLGSRPVVWLASGDVVIDGVLDLDGEDGHAAGAPAFTAIGGAGGFEGGTGGNFGLSSTPGSGPGGGGKHHGNEYGAGAGHVATGECTNGGSAYGNAFVQPPVGGSGGGGGGTSNNTGGGGGGGGGAIFIASSTKIVVNGTITANGGIGGRGDASNWRRGGAGSGGAIRLTANEIAGTGTVRANAAATRNGPSGDVDASGCESSAGRIRFEAFSHAFTGTQSVSSAGNTNLSGTVRFVTPGLVKLPTNSPTVRVVRVRWMDDGEERSADLPALPAASFAPADTTINASGEVIFDIEGRNVPLGTVVTLQLTNETTGAITFSSTGLAGTLASSTATAAKTIPHGFSRFTVEASF